MIIFCCLILFREFWSNPCTDWSWLWSNHRKLPAEAVTEVDPCIVLFWWKLYRKEAALPCFHCKVLSFLLDAARVCVNLKPLHSRVWSIWLQAFNVNVLTCLTMSVQTHKIFPWQFDFYVLYHKASNSGLCNWLEPDWINPSTTVLSLVEPLLLTHYSNVKYMPFDLTWMWKFKLTLDCSEDEHVRLKSRSEIQFHQVNSPLRYPRAQQGSELIWFSGERPRDFSRLGSADKSLHSL